MATGGLLSLKSTPRNDYFLNDRKHHTDSLRQLLANTKDISDSVRILRDLADITLANIDTALYEEIYDLAVRTKENSLAYGLLRRMSNLKTINTDPDKIKEYLDRVRTFPPSPEQKETEFFITIQHAVAKSHRLESNVQELQDSLEIFFHRYESLPEKMAAEKALAWFEYCIYLGHLSHTDILTNAFDRLSNLIPSFPNVTGSLRNLYFSQAANAYTRNGVRHKAIQADRKLLALIDTMEANALRDGRKFRVFNFNRFNSYRRLLNNYKSLSKADVSLYYNKILELAKIDPEVKREFDFSGRGRAFYHMANKEYSKALALLKVIVSDSARYSTSSYPLLIESMIEAADSVNDREALVFALKENRKILQNRIDKKISERVQELQLRFNTSEMQSTISNLKLEKTKALADNRLLTTLITLGFALILIVLSIILWWNLRRAKRYSRQVSEANRELASERDNLEHVKQDLIEARDKANEANREKADFINNISHEVKTPLSAITEYTRLLVDCMEDDSRKYLARYANIVTQNTELLQALVNDVLEVAESENSDFSFTPKPTEVNDVCNVVLETIHKHVKPGVTIEYVNFLEPERTIITDRHRLEQVLLNLLSNAAKFTPIGSIKLYYRINPESDSISFIVEDTGIGIPRGKEDIIFERFEKLDPNTEGYGLGLYISSMMAELIDGEIHLDSSYRQGARFVFTIPIHPQIKNSDNRLKDI